MTRRALAAVAGGLAASLLTGPAAHADGALPVSVADVRPGQVRLVAALPGGRTPAVTVSRDGYALPATVRAGVAAGATPARTLTVVVDAGPETLDTARSAVAALAGSVPDDVALGLVAATDPTVVTVSPTRDRAAFRAGLDRLRAEAGPGPLTALRTAAALAPRAGERRLLLLDAEAATGAVDPGAADALARAGQRLDVVTLGPAGAGLRELAAATGGEARSATDGTLAETLRSAAALPALFTITVAVPAELAGAATSLRVSTGAGAARRTADVKVRFAPAVAAPAEAGSVRPGWRLPRLGSGVLGVLVFAVLLVALLLVVFGVGGTRRQRRLDQVQRFRLAGQGGGVPVMSAAGFAGTVSNLSGRVARATGQEQRPDDARPVLGPGWKIRLAAVAVGIAVLGPLAGAWGIVLGGLLGALVTALYPRIREGRRRQSFADQLPDALQLIVSSLRSGFSLTQSLDAVVRDAPPGPLAVELGRAMAEVRLGADLADSLDRAAERAGNQDLAWAVIAIRIQHETGGNLAETLETTVDTIRERARLRRHVRALSAEGRLSAYLLLGLPVAIGAWMFLVSRDYLSVLWTTTAGLVMLVCAGLLMVLGAFWMSRWLKVEV
ncbi:type II secretion system F family protein [Asanoa hainanensis]|uniref:type II secretion system F family protein n=1 Tax=Asanoa hainanensis TaxID=560556 RepID=UPI00117E6BFE|nr:type II secretion system F family protein [Asanoa hainanensis]